MDIKNLYATFDSPVTTLDCGKKCAPFNPSGKPFCCDICHAVPAAYDEEWAYLQPNTDLWNRFTGDECETRQETQPEAPDGMVLLACLGPDRCQRPYRAISCRQFPFFPYISGDFRFLGLAYEWKFEETCWVISNLQEVTETYRREFVGFYDRLFDLKMQEMESYWELSEEMREVFRGNRRRIPLLHRDGKSYLVSPGSERMARVDAADLPARGIYRAT